MEDKQYLNHLQLVTHHSRGALHMLMPWTHTDSHGLIGTHKRSLLFSIIHLHSTDPGYDALTAHDIILTADDSYHSRTFCPTQPLVRVYKQWIPACIL